VLLLANVEPPTYSASATAAVLSELAEEGYLDASVGAMPLLFFAQKARYNAIGGTSPALSEFSRVRDSVESALREQAVKVDWATCIGPRRLAEQALRAVAAGHHDLVVVELAVATSLPMTAAKNEVDLLRLDDLGVDVRYAGGLGSSERVTSAVANAILERAGEPEGCGVVLVGHGQPRERSRRDPVVDEMETMFLNRLRMMLVERGMPESGVRVAWAEWVEPDVTSAVRHLAALGCTRVLVSPAVYPLDTLGTRLDLEAAVRRARVEESVSTAVLPAWRDNPAVIAEIRALVLAAMAPTGH
jgi:protoheme ferro-lyase